MGLVLLLRFSLVGLGSLFVGGLSLRSCRSPSGLAPTLWRLMFGWLSRLLGWSLLRLLFMGGLMLLLIVLGGRRRRRQVLPRLGFMLGWLS